MNMAPADEDVEDPNSSRRDTRYRSARPTIAKMEHLFKGLFTTGRRVSFLRVNRGV
jgi:hypothetical protein